MCDRFLISPVGQTHAHMHTQIIVKKYVMCISRGNKHGAPGVYFHVWHVKEIDLSKQGCVLNQKVERAWEGFLSRVVASRQQPHHPGGPRKFPINASLPFCLSCSETPVARTRSQLVASLSDPRSGHRATQVPQGPGAAGQLLTAVYLFCYISKSGLPCSLTFPGCFFFCCAFNPCSLLLLPQLRALRPQRAPPPGLPPLPLPSSRHSQRLENLLKALPAFQVRKNFYEVSALFFH